MQPSELGGERREILVVLLAGQDCEGLLHPPDAILEMAG